MAVDQDRTLMSRFHDYELYSERAHKYREITFCTLAVSMSRIQEEEKYSYALKEKRGGGPASASASASGSGVRDRLRPNAA